MQPGRKDKNDNWSSNGVAISYEEMNLRYCYFRATS